MELPENQARRIINRYTGWSMGAGLLPIPVVDLITLTGIQVRMLRLLAENYHVPFDRDLGKKLISSLLGVVVPVSLTNTLGSSLKLLPYVGQILGGLSLSLFAGATTNAMGKMFMLHFESGGTFLDFKPAKVRTYFQQEFERSVVSIARQRRLPAVRAYFRQEFEQSQTVASKSGEQSASQRRSTP